MSSHEVDLVVIGGGSAGVRAGRIAAGHGAKVIVAEEYRFGGTCVIRGCVPKKLLVHAARFAQEFEDAAGFGWTVEGARFDWPTLIANKDREIARIESVYSGVLGNAGAETLHTRAVIEDAHTVRLLDSGRSVKAGHILVATGGHPSLGPAIPGRELAISSNEAFHLAELPKRIVIQGGGFIALEFACLFHALGSEVTIVHRGDKVLRGFDEDVRGHVAGEMAARGITLMLGRTVAAIEVVEGARMVTLSDGTSIMADQVMFAIGRAPNTSGIGLNTAGVALDKVGAVVVDASSRSNVPSIYAVGDVTNRVNLTPVALREGHAFADSVFGSKPWTVDHTLVPSAVFSDPEVGMVGLTEAAAREKGHALDIYRTNFRSLKSTISGNPTRYLMKLVVDRDTDRVLGVHVVGEGAAEMVQVAAIAVGMGATKTDFDRTVALHPTAAEEMVTLRTKVGG